MGSALLSLQRGLDTLKISARQLIRERQAVQQQRCLLLFGSFGFDEQLHDAPGGKRGPGQHLNVTISRVPLSPAHQRVFMSTDLIAPNAMACGSAGVRYEEKIYKPP